MPFVTEEIWSYLPGGSATCCWSPDSRARSEARRDDEAEGEIEVAIALTREIRLSA